MTEDLDVFLADFGVACSSGATSGIGLLDMPSEVIADGMVITTDYTLTCRANVFGSVAYGASMTVDGVSYTVRETRLIDDGKFCVIALSKV